MELLLQTQVLVTAKNVMIGNMRRKEIKKKEENNNWKVAKEIVRLQI